MCRCVGLFRHPLGSESTKWSDEISSEEKNPAAKLPPFQLSRSGPQQSALFLSSERGFGGMINELLWDDREMRWNTNSVLCYRLMNLGVISEDEISLCDKCQIKPKKNKLMSWDDLPESKAACWLLHSQLAACSSSGWNKLWIAERPIGAEPTLYLAGETWHHHLLLTDTLSRAEPSRTIWSKVVQICFSSLNWFRQQVPLGDRRESVIASSSRFDMTASRNTNHHHHHQASLEKPKSEAKLICNILLMFYRRCRVVSKFVNIILQGRGVVGCFRDIVVVWIGSVHCQVVTVWQWKLRYAVMRGFSNITASFCKNVFWKYVSKLCKCS